MSIRKSISSIGKQKIILLSIGLGILFWVIDAFVDVFIFHERTLASQFINPTPLEIYIRLLNLSLLLVFGFIAQYLINRYAQATESLRESEELYRNLFDNAHDLIQSIAPDGRIIYVNPAWLNTMGYTLEELRQMTIFDILHPEHKTQCMNTLKNVISGGSKENIEAVFISKDGRVVNLEGNASVRLVDGTAVACNGIFRDITEQKKVAETLRKSEEKLRLYQTLINQSNDSVEVLDSETGKFLNVNQKTCSDLGYSREELLSMKVFDIDPMVKPANFPEIIEELRRTGGSIWHGVHLRKDGSTFPVEVSLKLVHLDRSYLVAVARDITERKKAELKYKTIIETTMDCFYIIDAQQGNILEVNDAYCSLIGYSRDELLKMSLRDVEAAEKPEEIAQHMQRIMTNGSDRFETFHRTKDGRILNIETSVNYMREANMFFVFMHDLTERKKMEDQVFQIKQDWEETFNIITDMITVHDKDFNIIRYNKAAEKILGLSFLNITKEKCYNFYHGTACAPAGCPSCMTFKTGVPSTVELFEPHLNMFIEIRAIPRFDSEHNLIGLIHVVRDITEHKKVENHLRQSQKMEAVGQLAGGVAHDFNNIITAIIGYSSIMKMKAGEDEYFRGLIDNVLAASEKAANLVQSLLAFSRKQVSNPEPVRINEIIKSIQKLLSIAAGEDIELKIELTEDLIVTADIVQIEQVMMNLCTNARDAMPAGGTLTIKTGSAELTRDFITAHGYGEEGRYALISVSDTGVGMDENTRQRIFEPFFTTKEFGKGTGLGLSIVYGIIKQHKGYITCQSEQGKGTTFNIYLPVVKAAMGEIKRIEPAEPAGAARTILFAEDEEEFRNTMKQILESSGYNVIEAVDGADAVHKFTENNNIDLLLFDIIMPKMSGKEAYDRIRNIKPDVKALFISGYPADFTNKYGVMEEGMNSISKPVRPAALLRKIIEALGNASGK